MILRVLDNTETTKVKDIQKIAANYNPSNNTTTICFDADIVTLGIVTEFLMTEYSRKRNKLSADMVEQLDTAIKKTLNGSEREN